MYPGRKPSGCKAAIWFHPGVHEQTKQSRSDGSAKQRAFVNEKRQETKRLRSDGSYEYPRAFHTIVGRRQIRP